MSSVIGLRGFQDAFRAYENLSIIRIGAFEEAEMAFLARGAQGGCRLGAHRRRTGLPRRRVRHGAPSSSTRPCRSTRSASRPESRSCNW